MSSFGSCFYTFANRGGVVLPPWTFNCHRQGIVGGLSPPHADLNQGDLNCNRNQSVTQESEALIEDLKESYGYTSDLRIEGLDRVRSLECQPNAEKQIGGILCRYRMWQAFRRSYSLQTSQRREMGCDIVTRSMLWGKCPIKCVPCSESI